LSKQDIEMFWRGMTAYNEGDLGGLLECFDPEVEFFPLRSAIEGPYHGHAGVRRWWADTADNWETFRVEVDEVRDLGDGRLVIAGLIHAKGKGGGVPLDIPTSWYQEMRDGLATKVKFFFDRDEAFRLFGLERAKS
jgi:ketosteroid isomerase-like protein